MRLFLSGAYRSADLEANGKAVTENASALTTNAMNDINSRLLELAPKATASVVAGEALVPTPETTEKNRKFALLTALQNAARQKLRDGQKLNPLDPQKGRWGGQPEKNSRKLSAVVTAMANSKNFFNVSITLSSTDNNNPLTDGDDIIFGIHDTFPSPIKAVQVSGGKATLDLVSYGAFTVGCFADGGKTELELDLAKLPDVPEVFRVN